jgi:hypothetical protein
MLKMYVWDNVLTDWTSGLIVVLATSLEEARDLACKDLGYVYRPIMTDTPDIYDSPMAVHVYGGA